MSITTELEKDIIQTDSNGYLGIGTTTPKAVLNTNNTLAVNNTTLRPSNSGETVYDTESLWLGKSTTSLQNYWGMSLGTIWSGASYIQCLNTNTNDYYNLLLQPNGGNVGIGTNNPTQKLYINANVDGQMVISGSNRTQLTGDLNAYMISLNASIASGTSMQNGWGPAIRFNGARYGGSINNACANIKGCIWSGANTSADYHMFAVDVYADNTTLQRGLEVRSSSVASCYTPGSFNASSSMVTSDDRMKFHETDIVDALSLINKLKPQKYEKYTPDFNIMKGAWMPKESEWDNVKKNNYLNEYGFIAQDVRSIPELSFLVTGNETIEEIDYISESEYNNLIKDEQEQYTEFYYYTDVSGEQITDIIYNNLEPEKKTLCTRIDKRNYRKTILTDQSLHLNYEGLFTVNIAAVQELSKKNDAKTQIITELQTKVSNLEAENAKLKADMALVKKKLGL